VVEALGRAGVELIGEEASSQGKGRGVRLRERVGGQMANRVIVKVAGDLGDA
jgi:hypothetical protein